MRISNISMLVAALLCATVAALLSRAWLKEQAEGQRALVASPETRMVAARSIVVAARELRFGETLKPDVLRLMVWPGDTVPRGAFLNMEPLVQAGQERTVVATIAENEPVLEVKISGSTQGALAAKLADSMNAVTIRVNDVAGVAGFVQADDRVDVFLTVGGQPGDNPGVTGASKASVAVLLQNVRVLATDQATQRNKQASPPKAVTLEVTTEDAQRLVLGGSIGQLSLALRRADGITSMETRPVVLDDLLKNQRGHDAAAIAAGGQVIGVTRAAERKEYTVQSDQPKVRRSDIGR